MPVAIVVAGKNRETWSKSLIIISSGLLAETRETAEAGAKLVKVEYTNTQQPILTAKDAAQKNSLFPIPLKPVVRGNVESALAAASNKIGGEMEIGTQNHFYMETMVSDLSSIASVANIWNTSPHHPK